MRVLAVPRSTPIAFAGKSEPALRKGQRISFKLWRRQYLGKETGRIFVSQAKSFSHAWVGDMTVRHVQPLEKGRVVLERLLPTLVRQLRGVRERGVRQGEGGRARHTARHVGHAVVADAVDYI